jgi:ribonuclease P protein component
MRGRARFAALRQGRKRRSGALTVTFILDEPGAASQPPRVAYAIGRGVGPAVVRNRVRRRLRVAAARAQLAPGTYLIAAAPPAVAASVETLTSDLRTAVGA